MKIAFSPYTLKFSKDPVRIGREGALLKFEFEKGNVGYADCHPWPELGDAPLAEQLKLLGAGRFTSLTSQSMIFSMLDGNARRRKENVFHGLTIPKSHFLVLEPDRDRDQEIVEAPLNGFTSIKIKVGRKPAHEIPILKKWIEMLYPSKCTLRLDFNCKLSEHEFLEYLHLLNGAREGVDFFEDPFPYQPKKWELIRSKQGIKVACDRESHTALKYPESCDILIVKPAVQNLCPFLSQQLHGRKLVFTSYLDHPLGQLAAAYAAASTARDQCYNIETCGLLSHQVYEPCPFNRLLSQEGAFLKPPSGNGFGFDDILRGLSWTSIN